MKVLTPISSQDASTNFTSAGVDLSDSVNFSVQSSFTGTDVAGTFKLQASNDNSDYIDITGASDAVSSSGTALLNVENAGYRYVRFDWAYTSGTGNITVTVVAKGRLPES